jgi:hypothetical protein
MTKSASFLFFKFLWFNLKFSQTFTECLVETLSKVRNFPSVTCRQIFRFVKCYTWRSFCLPSVNFLHITLDKAVDTRKLLISCSLVN